MTGTMKRQRPGIRVEQTTITISGEEMARLRREARQQGITVSRYVVNLIRLAWSVQGALATTPTAPSREDEQVPA